MYREFQRNDTLSDMNLQAPKYVPDETAATALLQYLTKEQLEEYLNDRSKIDNLIADLHQTKTIHKDRENIIVKNKSLAEFNLGLQPRLEQLKQQTASAYEEANTLKMNLAQDVAKLDAAPGCQSRDTMLAIFQTEVATADEVSEQIAEDFCDGKLDFDTFMTEYIPRRTEAYQKKAKLEKVGDLFRQGSTSTSQTVSYSTTNSSYNYTQTGQTSAGYSAANYGMGGAPYPSPQASFGMPLPHYQR